MQMETIFCKFGQISAIGYAYAARNDFVLVWMDLYDGKYSCAAGNNFMGVWTNVCVRKYFLCDCSSVARNSIRECAKTSVSTVMTYHSAQPKLVWIGLLASRGQPGSDVRCQIPSSTQP